MFLCDATSTPTEKKSRFLLGLNLAFILGIYVYKEHCSVALFQLSSRTLNQTLNNYSCAIWTTVRKIIFNDMKSSNTQSVFLAKGYGNHRFLFFNLIGFNKFQSIALIDTNDLDWLSSNNGSYLLISEWTQYGKTCVIDFKRQTIIFLNEYVNWLFQVIKDLNGVRLIQ